MYVQTRRPVGQLPQAPGNPWLRDILVTTAAIVIGTVVVEQLRRRRVL